MLLKLLLLYIMRAAIMLRKHVRPRCCAVFPLIRKQTFRVDALCGLTASGPAGLANLPQLTI